MTLKAFIATLAIIILAIFILIIVSCTVLSGRISKVEEERYRQEIILRKGKNEQSN